MKTIKKFVIVLGTLTVLTTILPACNTVAGMGQDVQAGTRAVGNTFSR